MKSAQRIIIAVIFSLIGLAAAGLTRSKPLPVYGVVPDFRVTADDGAPFDSSRLVGKLSLVSFFFASCQGPCPLLNAQMKTFSSALEGNPKVQLLSFSIDGERDTPEALREYAKKFGSPKNWRFLTGPSADIANFSEGTFKLAVDGSEKIHSTRIVLVDAEKQIRGSYSSDDEASRGKLLADVEALSD